MLLSRASLLTLVTFIAFDPIYCFPLTSSFHLQKDIGTIWQVTDFHLDVNYSTHGDHTQMCHNHATSPHHDHHFKDNLSTYGDYSCDSPWALVSSAVSAMKSIEASPDFILWTGDSIPHIKDSEDSLDKVYEVIGNITRLLRSTFPNTTIYPTVGNHDAYPSNQMPDTAPGSDFYAQLLTRSHWAELLQPDDQAQFITAGYYSTLISTGFRLISLNTNLYYSMNNFTLNTTDPGGQFEWLQAQLELATQNKEKVLLMAHVPPGIFERRAFLQWMRPDFNDQLVDILSNYSDTVDMQIYGHEHTDTFRLLYEDGVAASVMLMAPAVTPMNSTLPGVGPNNPGVRLYHYNRTSHRLLNYHQYYLNLSNIRPRVNHAVWQLEYRALEDLPLDNFSAAAFFELVSGFSFNKTSPFRRYLRYNTVSYQKDPIPDQCTLAEHVCAIMYPSMHGYMHCAAVLSQGKLNIDNAAVNFDGISSVPPMPFSPSYSFPSAAHPRRSVHIYVYYIVAVCSMCLCLAFVILAVLRKRYTSTPYLLFRYHPLTNRN
ncbi:acid sphingomyelinase-like phosphodiesterase 3b isoform X2 [Octopus bimaculoides]|uniref:acid sphingomyelinase-like phosphodiesterase 3b isoform X2 n=1 Tax=Octopus bimaculoides TaxID=37653 RepID=UPI00071DE252|nr:acid sphingomyelinase-like phosphodiesterase 3b isoform X2 [Octopus bimaculoides]|eukprot:XP_014783621.1 PREDICTED: acid sphingomyelinase-like phosphodiesterase 3b [Octopus bimaculoides]